MANVMNFIIEKATTIFTDITNVIRSIPLQTALIAGAGIVLIAIAIFAGKKFAAHRR